MLIDAILRNGGTSASEANHVPPPTGWRDEDIGHSETSNASGDEKKSYTEDQRQGVLRCAYGFYIFDMSFFFYKETELTEPFYVDCVPVRLCRGTQKAAFLTVLYLRHVSGKAK